MAGGSNTLVHDIVLYIRNTNLQVHIWYGHLITLKCISRQLSSTCIHTFERGWCLVPVAIRAQAICAKVSRLKRLRELAATVIWTDASSGGTRGRNRSIVHGIEGLRKFGG